MSVEWGTAERVWAFVPEDQVREMSATASIREHCRRRNLAHRISGCARNLDRNNDLRKRNAGTRQKMHTSGGSTPPVVVGRPATPLYNRRETPTQTRADAQKQVTSMEVWGAPARGSNLPSVKAYRTAMVPPHPRGIEFCWPVNPTPGTGTPFEARWYLGSPGVVSRQGSTFAAIAVSYIKNTQVP